MKDETGRVSINEFVGLKPKMYSFLVDDSSEHKKAKCVNKNVVATISHDEYKHFLLNKKCLRHSMSGIQGKVHRIGALFEDKIYIQNNGYNGLAFDY